ncbi:MAG: 2-(3-amino-3-carboxypropyl)histidine synthase subunit [Candidatus Pacearchaeota archaeon]|nr:2-(3-amino-3-carboxypropyl)histidine synthase subunit [Candidatus Pacearchaeota archaeon]
MKIFYVSAKQDVNVPVSVMEDLAKKVPDETVIVTTLQFSDFAKKFFRFLKKRKKVFMDRDGIVLGCDLRAAKKFEKKASSFLYIGSGNFHPLVLALEINKPVFVFNPNTLQFFRLQEKEIKKFEARKRAAYSKVVASEKIGILVSIKKGQLRLKEALKLKRELEKKGKKVYIFLFDTFFPEQLENWKEIAWINTACPGISLEQNFLEARHANFDL